MSTYNDVLTNVVATVQFIGLTWNNLPVPVALHKLPKKEEGLDSTPLIVVAPGDKGEQIERKVFKGFFLWLPVDIAVIAAGDGDFTSNLDTYLGWRQPLRQVLQRPTLPGVPAVFDARVEPDAVIDRERANQSYDLTLLRVNYRYFEALQ